MSDTHALVIGGSMAGLCAARVLADAFDRVTIVERDLVPADGSERAGVPQARHVHALLERGRRELDALFPGFDDRLRAAGAHFLDFGLEFAFLRELGWQPRKPSPYKAWFASRSLIEASARVGLAGSRAVRLVERQSVTGLLADGNGHARVRGVRLQARDGGATAEIPADLVVDASGRASHATDWLRTLGLTPPEETVVNSFTGYATRWYRVPPPGRWPRSWWWRGCGVDPVAPGHMTAGMLVPVEGDRWIATIAGISRHYPPVDEAGWLDAVRGLRSPIMAEALALAEPVSPIHANREMENRFRHYERWQERLDGFVALGDAACKFNPVYGQGITSAVVCARLLGEAIAATGPKSPDLPRRFFRRQARFLEEPWSLAVGADFRFEATEGPRPPLAAVTRSYMDALFSLSFEDDGIRDTLVDVIHMMRPATALFAPALAARVGLRLVGRLAGLAPPGVVTPFPPGADGPASCAA
jgi:2-polyprenyl-6-methoxyphenol hydroxylase-like FAD-dependent oxidoreductase